MPHPPRRSPRRARLPAAVLPLLLAASLHARGPMHDDDAATADDADLAALLETVRTRHDLPALGVATIDSEGVVRRAVAGVRMRGGSGAVTLDDRWHLGSCTKAMTAVLAARLVERGRLRWDATIAEMLPAARDGDPAYATVTLEQLLRHRGGLPSDVLDTPAWREAWAERGTIDRQRAEFVRSVLAMPPAVPPGEFLYSNQGYAIAGRLCEIAGGAPFESLLRDEVFAPLGMASADYGAPAARDPDQPRGHRADGAPVSRTLDNPPAVTPAGRVHATLADWASFVAIFLGKSADGGAISGPATPPAAERPAAAPFLSSSALAHLTALPEGDGADGYALGWGIAHRPWGGRVLTHAGSNTTWYCVAWVVPAKGRAVLVTCNQGGDVAAKACDEVAAAIVGEWR